MKSDEEDVMNGFIWVLLILAFLFGAVVGVVLTCAVVVKRKEEWK